MAKVDEVKSTIKFQMKKVKRGFSSARQLQSCGLFVTGGDAGGCRLPSGQQASLEPLQKRAAGDASSVLLEHPAAGWKGAVIYLWLKDLRADDEMILLVQCCVQSIIINAAYSKRETLAGRSSGRSPWVRARSSALPEARLGLDSARELGSSSGLSALADSPNQNNPVQAF